MGTTALDKFSGRANGTLSGYFRLYYFTGDYWEADYFRGDTGYVWSPTTTDKFSGAVTSTVTDKFSGALTSTIVTQVP